MLQLLYMYIVVVADYFVMWYQCFTTWRAWFDVFIVWKWRLRIVIMQRLTKYTRSAYCRSRQRVGRGTRDHIGQKVDETRILLLRKSNPTINESQFSSFLFNAHDWMTALLSALGEHIQTSTGIWCRPKTEPRRSSLCAWLTVRGPEPEWENQCATGNCPRDS